MQSNGGALKPVCFPPRFPLNPVIELTTGWRPLSSLVGWKHALLFSSAALGGIKAIFLNGLFVSVFVFYHGVSLVLSIVGRGRRPISQ